MITIFLPQEMTNCQCAGVIVAGVHMSDARVFRANPDDKYQLLSGWAGPSRFVPCLKTWALKMLEPCRSPTFHPELCSPPSPSPFASLSSAVPARLIKHWRGGKELRSLLDALFRTRQPSLSWVLSSPNILFMMNNFFEIFRMMVRSTTCMYKR